MFWLSRPFSTEAPASADADAQDVEFVTGGRVAELLTQNRAGYDR